MSLSFTEENYIKCIYHLSNQSDIGSTSTNTIAEDLNIKPATVTSMLKKLRDKKIISYERYGKIQLSKKGNAIAIEIIRKHRLWEVFLVNKLDFTWDEVHEIAEQLEHIQSKKLIDKLDEFLEFPEYDPHGDPIPNNEGKIKPKSKSYLSEAKVGGSYRIVAVNDSSSEFLQYLMQLQITLSTIVKVLERIQFDNSLLITLNKQKEFVISEKIAQNLIIE